MRSAAIRLAAFAVISGALTLWIAGEITGADPEDSYELVASFDDVAGLYRGDDVRLAGIPVGRVSHIEVVDGTAGVRFVVDEAVEVPSDSTVAVRWRNLIGQRFLSIEPGTASTMLGDGDTVAESDDVVDLGRVVNQLSPLAQAVGPDQVNRILTALVTAFEGNEGNYDALLADLGSLSDVLAEREGQLGQMLADYDTITSAIASRDDQIAAMATNLASITGTLNATDDLISTAMTEFAAFADGTETLLARSEEDLGAVLEHVAALTGTIVGDLDLVEQAIQTMPEMLDAVLPTINRGPYLRVNLLCISAGPGACPHPLLFFEDEGA
jgi:phospholipid/cholesterol/gamma-HCH transport system substrate-binding protein